MTPNTVGDIYGSPITTPTDQRAAKRGILLGAVNDWQAAATWKQEDAMRAQYHLGRYQGARDALLSLGMRMSDINDALASGTVPDLDAQRSQREDAGR